MNATRAAAVGALLLLSLSAADAAGKSCEQYEATTLSVLNKVIWPTSRNITVSGIAPTEFDQNANGRVVPGGVFSGALGEFSYC